MFYILSALLALVALPRVARAKYTSDVQYAVVVLNDLSAPFASSFCEDFVKTYVPTGTFPPGPEQTITTTTTVEPASCTSTPAVPVITVSSTTTITCIVTSTIVVAPSAPAGYKRAAGLQTRVNWCDDYGLPCRLVKYENATIAEACGVFLGGEVVVTATVTGTSCGGYDTYPTETTEEGHLTEKSEEAYPTTTEETYPTTTEEGYSTSADGGYGHGGDEQGGQDDWYTREPYVNK